VHDVTIALIPNKRTKNVKHIHGTLTGKRKKACPVVQGETQNLY